MPSEQIDVAASSCQDRARPPPSILAALYRFSSPERRKLGWKVPRFSPEDVHQQSSITITGRSPARETATEGGPAAHHDARPRLHLLEYVAMDKRMTQKHHEQNGVVPGAHAVNLRARSLAPDRRSLLALTGESRGSDLDGDAPSSLPFSGRWAGREALAWFLERSSTSRFGGCDLPTNEPPLVKDPSR